MTVFEKDSVEISLAVLIVSLVAAFATIWYVKIAAKTLKEIGIQRVNTYLPEIVIEALPFYTYTSKENNFPIEFTYTRRNPDEKDFFYFQLIALNMKCYNVGFGAAKNIKISFDFDIKKAIKTIHDFSPKEELFDQRVFAIDVDDRDMSIQHIDGLLSMINIFETQEYSFILPGSFASGPSEIPLPGYISHLYAIYSFIKWKQIQKRVEIPQFPAIKVRFAYQDINNSIHKKENSIDLVWKGGRENETWNEMNVSN